MTRAKRRKLMRPDGNCYRIALEEVVKHKEPGVLLVHGEVWSVLLKRMIEHAWIYLPVGLEIRDGYNDVEILKTPAILDLTLKKEHRLLPEWFFLEVAKPIEHARYTWQEAVACNSRFGVWGPWHHLTGASASALPQKGATPCDSRPS